MILTLNLRLQNDLAKMIIVAIRIDYLHQVIEYFELLQQFNPLYQNKEPLYYILSGGEKSEPGEVLSKHGVSQSFLGEESLIISRTYQRLLLSAWLAWDASCIRHLLLVSVREARSRACSCPVHLGRLRGAHLLLATRILILPLLFTVVCSALFQIVDLSLEDVTNLLKETLFVVENIVLVLDESETKHEKHSWRIAQSLLTLFRS